MNRNVMIGGIAAVVVLLGLAGYLIWAGRGPDVSGGTTAIENQGPVALNPVAIITDHSANQSEDGHRLTLAFPQFELVAKPGETTSAVFSTTWRLKLAADERVVVASAALGGYMKSTGAPAPVVAPAPAPASAPTPSTDAPATTPPAAEPAKPATPAPAAPVAGDGVARVIVAFGSEATVTEWRDGTGSGADRRLSKAISFVGSPSDLRDGGTIPVTVTVELSGNAAMETQARLSSIDLQLFVENAPLPAPVATTPATPGTAPADAPPTPPADTTAPATPPADSAPATTPSGTPTP